jgi:hypothetical protein
LVIGRKGDDHMCGLPAKRAGGTKAFESKEEGHSAAQDSQQTKQRNAWYLLLLFPYIGLLWPPLYTRSEPTLFSFPFFYWYQFLWVPLSAILTGIVYLITRRR